MIAPVIPNKEQARNDLLFEAAKAGDAEQVAHLISLGADVNSYYNLIFAAHSGHLDVVYLLLEAGADKSFVSNGLTAAEWARNNNHAKIAEVINKYMPPTPDQVITHSPLGDRTLQEVFNFATMERISMIRNGRHGPVESFVRESFSVLADQPSLREAFKEHRRRGGTAEEEAVFSRFTARLDKSTPTLGEP